MDSSATRVRGLAHRLLFLIGILELLSDCPHVTPNLCWPVQTQRRRECAYCQDL